MNNTICFIVFNKSNKFIGSYSKSGKIIKGNIPYNTVKRDRQNIIIRLFEKYPSKGYFSKLIDMENRFNENITSSDYNKKCKKCKNKYDSMRNEHFLCFLEHKLDDEPRENQIMKLILLCIENENYDSFFLINENYPDLITNFIHSIYIKLSYKENISNELKDMIYYICYGRENLSFLYKLLLSRDNINFFKYLSTVLQHRYEYFYDSCIKYKSYKCLKYMIENDFPIQERHIYYCIREKNTELLKIINYNWNTNHLNHVILCGDLDTFIYLIEDKKVKIDYSYIINNFIDIERKMVVAGDEIINKKLFDIFRIMCKKMIEEKIDGNKNLIDYMYECVFNDIFMNYNRFILNIYSVLEIYEQFIDMSDYEWNGLIINNKFLKHYNKLYSKHINYLEYRKKIREEINNIIIPDISDIIISYI